MECLYITYTEISAWSYLGHMKTVIFLNSSRFKWYDLQALSQEYRLVAIMTEAKRFAFPATQQPYIAQFYTVPEAADCYGLIEFKIDLVVTKKAVAAEIAKAGGADNVVIICADESNMSLAAYLRSEFSIAGMSYEQMMPYRDKLVMKKRLMQAGIAVPQFTHFDKQQLKEEAPYYFAELEALLGVPFIIKPTQGAASSNTFVITSFDDLIQNHHDILATQETLEAETFIEGEMYHCDSLIQNGEYVLTFCSEYSTGNLDLVLGKTIATMPLDYADPLYEHLKQFSRAAIDALGRCDGSVHMEMFVKPSGDIIFLEAGARTPGGPIIPLYERMYGVNFLQCDFAISVNKPLVIPAEPAKKIHMFAAITPLMPNGSQSLEEPSDMESCYETILEVAHHHGQKATSVRDYSGMFFAYNKEKDPLRRDFEKIRQAVHEEKCGQSAGAPAA